MNRKNIEKIIDKLDDIHEKNYYDDFYLAVYIYIRLGRFEFNNYIGENDLEAINEVLKRYDTLFDEEINNEVSMILNEENDDKED